MSATLKQAGICDCPVALALYRCGFNRAIEAESVALAAASCKEAVLGFVLAVQQSLSRIEALEVSLLCKRIAH